MEKIYNSYIKQANLESSKESMYFESFFAGFLESWSGFKLKLIDLNHSIPNQYSLSFDSFSKMVMVFPLKLLVEYNQDVLKIEFEKIESLLKQHLNGEFISFLNSVESDSLIDSIDFYYSRNFKFSVVEFLDEFHKYFTFLSSNQDLRRRIYSESLDYIHSCMPTELIPTQMYEMFTSVDDFEKFYKNNIFNKLFNSLNTLILNGYPILQELDNSYFPKDIDIYWTLLEFVFSQQYDDESSLACFIFKVLTYYERDYGFSIDEYVLENLVMSSKSLDLQSLTDLVDYGQLICNYFEVPSIHESVDDYKYKNVYLYILLTQIMISFNVKDLSAEDLITLGSEFIVDYLIENPLHFPMLMKDKNIQKVFLASLVDFSSQINFDAFQIPKFTNREKLIQVLRFHYRKKNIRSVIFISYLIVDLKKESLMLDLIDKSLSYFTGSKKDFSRYTSFFYLLFQEKKQLGESAFSVNLSRFLSSGYVFKDLDSFIRAYKISFLQSSNLNLSDIHMSSILNDESPICSKIFTVLRNLIMRSEDNAYIESLLDAHLSHMNGNFLEYKFYSYGKKLFKKLGPVAHTGEIVLQVRNDLNSLLSFGKIPYETCFAYDQPLTSKFLVSYIVEPSVSLWAICKGGVVLARRIMILAKFQNKDILVAMPLYSSDSSSEFLSIAENLTIFYANSSNYDLIIYDQKTGFHPVMASVFDQPSTMFDIQINFERLNAFKFDFMACEDVIHKKNQLGLYSLNLTVSGHYFKA